MEKNAAKLLLLFLLFTILPRFVELQQQQTEGTNKKVTPYTLWSLPIRYFISNELARRRQEIYTAINVWKEKTCLSFTELPTRPTEKGSWIEFIDQGPHLCGSSHTGMKVDGYGQSIHFGFGCTLKNLIHELGHSIGLIHEHQRKDRHQYVKIKDDNVDHLYDAQFEIIESSLTDSSPYDYGSIMHYKSNAYPLDDEKTTIETLDPHYEWTIGQRSQLSYLDLKRVNMLYCSNSCPVKLACLRCGYTDPQICSQCRCVPGIGGPLCGQVQSQDEKCPDKPFLIAGLYTPAGHLTFTGIGKCHHLIVPQVIALAIKFKIVIEEVGFDQYRPIGSHCDPANSLEIRYKKDLQTTGARFCANLSNGSITIYVEGNEIMVLYQSTTRYGSYKLRYELDFV